MTAERLRRIRELFEATRQQPPTDRRRFLEEDCGTDAALLQEVERLLHAHEHAAGFLETPAASLICHSGDGTTAKTRRHPSPFAAGSIISGRYRIEKLLGSGGMGEVYRAYDLTLGQDVALKFLSRAKLTGTSLALEYLYREARTARQVSHPNVCRVYDIGEVDGEPFLSMEYIDGDDLASVLRQKGRIPRTDAIGIIRGVCAGLAAAHQKGVLHRDLKPSNIMIDSRGHVAITDFGLAGIADQFQPSEIRDGTPDYMAPEQLAGREVSVRSDIYSLGLVICEMLTGRRPSAGSDELSRDPVRTSSLPSGLDTDLQQIVLRCLDPDPGSRPSSALSVAAAVSGRDVLTTALEAGLTPNPEMVASGQAVTCLSVKICLALMILVLCGLPAVAILSERVSVIGATDIRNTPGIAAQKARDLLNKFGYIERAQFSHLGLSYQTGLYLASSTHQTERMWRGRGVGESPIVRYWYRESPEPMIAATFIPFPAIPGVVRLHDPPLSIPGMLSMELDTKGRLLSLHVVTAPRDAATEHPGAPEPAALLEAAGFDPGKCRAVKPVSVPKVVFDTQAAWAVEPDERHSELFRVEAAFWRGRPVSFEMFAPSRRFSSSVNASYPTLRGTALFLLLSLTVTCGACVVARRNMRSGCGDVKAAFRLAGTLFVSEVLAWLFGASHVASYGEIQLFDHAASAALFPAVLIWIVYVALEPNVRRYGPHLMISWTRLLGGDLRDASVGTDILIGCAAGVLIMVALQLRCLIAGQFVWRLLSDLSPYPETLLGFRPFLRVLFSLLSTALLFSLSIFFLYFLLHRLLRYQWLVSVCFGASLSICIGSVGAHPGFDLVSGVLISALFWLVMMRFGLLALVVTSTIVWLLLRLPTAGVLTSWYGGYSLCTLAIAVLFALYGFHTAVANRSTRSINANVSFACPRLR